MSDSASSMRCKRQRARLVRITSCISRCWSAIASSSEGELPPERLQSEKIHPEGEPSARIPRVQILELLECETMDAAQVDFAVRHHAEQDGETACGARSADAFGGRRLGHVVRGLAGPGGVFGENSTRLSSG